MIIYQMHKKTISHLCIITKSGKEFIMQQTACHVLHNGCRKKKKMKEYSRTAGSHRTSAGGIL